MKRNLILRYKIVFPILLAASDIFAYLRYLSIKASVIDPYGSVVDYRAVLALSLLCVLPLTFFYKRPVNVLFLVAKLVMQLFIFTLANDDLAITVILSSAYLFAAGFYLRLPYNIALSLLAGVAIMLFQRSIPLDVTATPTIGSDQLVMLGFLFALIIAFNYIVSSIIESQEELDARLEAQRQTIIRLIETNVGIQRFAMDKKEEFEGAERQRITRDIHDTIGYVMTNNIMLLRACTYYVPSRLKKARSFIDDALKNAEGGLAETRSILKRLHDINDGPKGAGEILKIAQLFQESTGVRVKCSFGNTMGTWGKELDYAFYRIIQEGLVNSVKHGKATEISVGFWQDDDELLLTISDNGSGKHEDHARMGIGLRGMKERLARFGGRLEARGSVQGFSLHIAVPIARERAEGAYESH